jgi:hypothetical protein
VTDIQEHLARVLTPVAPPRVLEPVYTDDEYERLLGVVQQHGPWPIIAAHHFETVDELIATTTGVVPKDHGLTLDDVAAAQFRGFFAKNSVCFHPELEDVFYNTRFLEEIRSYWNVPYAKPTMMLFNLCGPDGSGTGPPHLDAVTFRGVRIENTPIWLQNVMAKSGLFSDYLVKMGQIITWWYLGPEGTFTYWPDGPLQPPKRLDHPLWNKGVVVQNEMMFHRGDPVGEPRPIEGLKHRSLIGYEAEDDAWTITTDGEPIRRYEPSDMRLLVHWNAELYADMDECRKVMDHTDDLSHDQVVDTLIADLRSKGRKVTMPSDPLHDVEFIQTLTEIYTIAPTTDWIDRVA